MSWLSTARIAPVLAAMTLLPVIAEADDVPPFDNEKQASYRQVTWDDFRGKARRAGEEQARIATAIQAAPIDVKASMINKGYWVALPLSIRFYAAMDKSSSAVGRGGKTELLLAHEQGHFDLTEVMARRLGQRLAGVEGQGASAAKARANVMGKIQRAHDEAVEELRELQARYDRETYHGRSHLGQDEWAEKIAEMLREASAAAG